MKHAWEDETCVRVFGWRTRKEKTTQEASGESKWGCEDECWIRLTQDRVKWQVLVNDPLLSRKVVTVIFSRRTAFIGYVMPT